MTVQLFILMISIILKISNKQTFSFQTVHFWETYFQLALELDYQFILDSLEVNIKIISDPSQLADFL